MSTTGKKSSLRASAAAFVPKSFGDDSYSSGASAAYSTRPTRSAYIASYSGVHPSYQHTPEYHGMYPESSYYYPQSIYSTGYVEKVPEELLQKFRASKSKTSEKSKLSSSVANVEEKTDLDVAGPAEITEAASASSSTVDSKPETISSLPSTSETVPSKSETLSQGSKIESQSSIDKVETAAEGTDPSAESSLLPSVNKEDSSSDSLASTAESVESKSDSAIVTSVESEESKLESAERKEEDLVASKDQDSASAPWLVLQDKFDNEKMEYQVEFLLAMAEYFLEPLECVSKVPSVLASAHEVGSQYSGFGRRSSGKSFSSLSGKSRSFRSGGRKATSLSEKREIEEWKSWRAEQLKPSENGFRIVERSGLDKVLGEVKSIMNKLTPEKFEILIPQLFAKVTETMDASNDIVKIIFEKAVNEVHFAKLYADTCLKLIHMLAQSGTEHQKQLRRSILRMCQFEFENKSNFDFEQFSSLPAAERDEAIMKLKNRETGLVTFIGHMYNSKIISAAVIRKCVEIRLKSQETPNLEGLESIVKLFTVMGKKFEAQQGSNLEFMDLWFGVFKRLSEDSSCPARLRFAVMDLLELREDLWVPRRVIESAKKIKDVHKETSPEKPARKSKVSSSKPAPKVLESDEWTTKRRAAKDRKRGSTSKARKSSEESTASRKSASKADFAVLAEEPVFNGFDALREVSSDEDAGDRSEMLPKSVEIADLPVVREETKLITEEEANIQIERYVAYFLESLDFESALTSFKSLGTQFNHLIVSFAMNRCFDDNRVQSSMSDLLVHLNADGFLTTEHVISGLSPILEIFDDISIDCPLAPSQLSFQLSRLISKGSLTLSIFENSVFEPLRESGTSSRLFLETIKQIASEDERSVDSEAIKKISLERLLSPREDASEFQARLNELVGSIEQ